MKIKLTIEYSAKSDHQKNVVAQEFKDIERKVINLIALTDHLSLDYLDTTINFEGFGEIMDEDDAAIYLGVSKKRIKELRTYNQSNNSKPLKFMKNNRKIFYCKKDLDGFKKP